MLLAFPVDKIASIVVNALHLVLNNLTSSWQVVNVQVSSGLSLEPGQPFG